MRAHCLTQFVFAWRAQGLAATCQPRPQRGVRGFPPRLKKTTNARPSSPLCPPSVSLCSLSKKACAGMRWGSGTSASVPAARVRQFTRAIASQCGAAWSRTGTSSTAAGRSSVRWHIRTSGGEGWRCNMVGMVGSSWAEVQQRGICAYIVPSQRLNRLLKPKTSSQITSTGGIDQVAEASSGLLKNGRHSLAGLGGS